MNRKEMLSFFGLKWNPFLQGPGGRCFDHDAHA